MGLRLQAQMAADLDRGRRERLQNRQMRAFEFHDIGAGGDEFPRIGERRRRQIIGLIRQVADNRRLGRAAAHSGDMVAHVGQRHLALAGVAEHVHADAIADQYDVDARRRLGPGGGGVIGGEDGDFRPCPLHLEKSRGLAHPAAFSQELKRGRIEAGRPM